MATSVKRNRVKKTDSETRIQGMNKRIILDAALEVFSSYGFRGSTLDQISEKAGMSKPNLLYYYPSKQAIYVTVLENTLEEWLQPFEQLNPAGDPMQELRKYISSKLEMSFQKPEASRLFANEIINGAPAIGSFLETHLKKLVDSKVGVINEWIAQGRIAQVDPYHLIFMIWSTTQHYADFSAQINAVIGEKTDTKIFREKAAQTVANIILAGINPAKI